MPCVQCKMHLRQNLRENPLTDEILSVKLKLIMWCHNLHNIVNALTNKPVLSFEDAMLSLFTGNIEGTFTVQPSDNNETVESLLEEYKLKRRNGTETFKRIKRVE